MDNPPSTKWGTTPSICPSSLARSIMIANISATILNNMSDKGSPCLNPFLVWKKRLISSLTLTTKLPPETQLWIKAHDSFEKPFILRVCWRNDHFIYHKPFQSQF